MDLSKKIWYSIKYFVGIIFGILFVVYFILNRDDFLIVFSLPVINFLILISIMSLHLFINGLYILVFLKRFNHLMGCLESFYLSIISSLANIFIPMQGGIVLRSLYLKKTLQFPYAHFIATLYANYIVIFGVNAFFALLSLLMINKKFDTIPYLLFIFFGLVLIGTLVLAFVRIKIFSGSKRRSKLIIKVFEIVTKTLKGWEIISSDKGLLVILVWITLGNYFVMTIIYAIEFSSLGIHTNLVILLLYNCLSGVSLLVSLTPGALGVREGIFFLTSDVLGLGSEQIMQLALLDRGITVITLIICFVIISLLKKFSNTEKN